jgi:hypothetical protein
MKIFPAVQGSSLMGYHGVLTGKYLSTIRRRADTSFAESPA